MKLYLTKRTGMTDEGDIYSNVEVYTTKEEALKTIKIWHDEDAEALSRYCNTNNDSFEDDYKDGKDNYYMYPNNDAIITRDAEIIEKDIKVVI